MKKLMFLLLMLVFITGCNFGLDPVVPESSVESRIGNLYEDELGVEIDIEEEEEAREEVESVSFKEAIENTKNLQSYRLRTESSVMVPGRRSSFQVDQDVDLINSVAITRAFGQFSSLTRDFSEAYEFVRDVDLMYVQLTDDAIYVRVSYNGEIIEQTAPRGNEAFDINVLENNGFIDVIKECSHVEDTNICNYDKDVSYTLSDNIQRIDRERYAVVVEGEHIKEVVILFSNQGDTIIRQRFTISDHNRVSIKQLAN